MAKRNEDLADDFNKFYKSADEHATTAGRFTIACSKTAAKYYLSIKRVQTILKSS
jgi:hypothetical protein